MIRVDYSNYLDQQNQWASSLVRLARTAEPIQARELGEAAAATLRRMLGLTDYRYHRTGLGSMGIAYTAAYPIWAVYAYAARAIKGSSANSMRRTNQGAWRDVGETPERLEQR